MSRPIYAAWHNWIPKPKSCLQTQVYSQIYWLHFLWLDAIFSHGVSPLESAAEPEHLSNKERASLFPRDLDCDRVTCPSLNLCLEPGRCDADWSGLLNMPIPGLKMMSAIPIPHKQRKTRTQLPKGEDWLLGKQTQTNKEKTPADSTSPWIWKRVRDGMMRNLILRPMTLTLRLLLFVDNWNRYLTHDE